MQRTRLILVLTLIFCGAITRFLPHLPNFTAINAIALFGAHTLGSWNRSLFTVLSTMLFTDCFFGFHATLPYVYLSVGVIVLLGYYFKSSSVCRNMFFLAPLSSLLFFLITNFGSWMTNPFYPKTLSGLSLCYLAGLPFLANQFLGDFFYVGILFLVARQSGLVNNSERHLFIEN